MNIATTSATATIVRDVLVDGAPSFPITRGIMFTMSRAKITVEQQDTDTSWTLIASGHDENGAYAESVWYGDDPADEVPAPVTEIIERFTAALALVY